MFGTAFICTCRGFIYILDSGPRKGPKRIVWYVTYMTLSHVEINVWQTEPFRFESLTKVSSHHYLRNIYIYIYRFQNVFLRCPTPRFHCFLSSHWPSFRFLSFMSFLIPSIQFFFGLPPALFCFGIHFNAILGNLPSAILWTWPYHVSWFCSVSFIIVSSSPICCLIVTFLILSFLDII